MRADRVPPEVHIVDDEPWVRDALSLLVRSVGYSARMYSSADEFLDRFAAGASGCVLMDVRMPGISGLEFLARWTRQGAGLPVIIMTGHGDVPMAVRAMKHGPFDCIEKPFNDQALLDRLADATAHTGRTIDRVAERTRAVARHAQLSPREREIMAGIVEGRLNKTIASELGISVRTVEIHRAHLMDKMHARNLSALVRMAVLIEDVAEHAPRDSG
jgi:FixJ family two-component response regulator